MEPNRNYLLYLVFLVLTLTACSPSENQIQPPTSIPPTSAIHFVTATPLSTSMRTLTLTPALPETFTGTPASVCEDAGIPSIVCTGVTANDQWKPLIRAFNQIEMVLVPAGCFQMGNDDGDEEEQPAHLVCINEPFWIDLTEVTVAQFADFLNGQPEPVESMEPWRAFMGAFNTGEYETQIELVDSVWRPNYWEVNHAVRYVTWVGASDYCAWREARLPTEAEWEYAARGPNGYLYPWGNELVMENFFISRATMDVGTIPEGASWVGALDMAAGLFEWTSSLFWPYPYRADDGREAGFAENSTGTRVFRGSPWYHGHEEFDNISATARFDGPTNYAFWYHGFRCALSIDW